MLNVNVFTTADHFMHYIPMFAYTMRKILPEALISIAVMGELDEATKQGLSHVPDVSIHNSGEVYYRSSRGVAVTQNVLSDIPVNPSTANTARYLYFPKHTSGPNDPAEFLITDIDILHFDAGIIKYLRDGAKKLSNGIYHAHHGPWKKFERFPGKSWKGDYERLAGGVIYLTEEWLHACDTQIHNARSDLEAGKVGMYREADEVLFCNICKKSGLPINQDKYFPQEYRGVHLGDFKESMRHRYTDSNKMYRLLSLSNAREFSRMANEDEVFKKIMSCIPLDSPVNLALSNAITYCNKIAGIASDCYVQ